MALSDDPLIEKLKKLTPEKAGLDRDAFLIAAGRASARGPYRWIWLLAGVVAAQSVALAWLLWARTELPQPGANTVPVAPVQMVENKGTPQPADNKDAPKPASPKTPDAQPEDQPKVNIPGPKPDFLPDFKSDFGKPDVVPFTSKKSADSFVVPLLDGRQLTVKPSAEKLNSYHVTPKFFEQHVRQRLGELFVQYPNEVWVLRGLTSADKNTPSNWRPDPNDPEEKQFVTVGDKLENLAHVEFTGEKAPYAPDLERMVSMHWTVTGIVAAEKGMSRAEFEKKFGALTSRSDIDRKLSVNQPTRDRIYPVAAGKLLVRFEGSPETVALLHYLEPEPPGNLEEVPAQERGRFFRAVYQTERDFLFAFLLKRFHDADADQMRRLHSYVEQSNRLVGWTEQERSQLFSESP